jgi:serine O-acetyltransferase
LIELKEGGLTMFDDLVKINCHSKNRILKLIAKNLLEKFYGCEISCMEIDKTVLFAHHARGCIIIAAKICANVVIFQNVTIGTNMKFNKTISQWENIGNPIISKNVVIADGAKILGPITIGENSVVAAGAIITKDVPSNNVAYGVNKLRPKDEKYDLLYNPNMVSPEKLIESNNKRIEKFNKNNDENTRNSS